MTVTIGLIGIGDILASHLDALDANREFKLVSVCRRSKDRLQKQARELGAKGFTDYRDLLADPPDVVLVSLPHSLHAQATCDAFRAGCHVLVEKPMAVSAQQCRHMLHTAQQTGKHLVVTESASFHPGALLTGEKFKAGQLGSFFTGSIINERAYFHQHRPKWFLDPEASGGGMFSNVGLHRLATARAVLPALTPTSVCASVSYVPEYDVEACTTALVKYRQGGAMLYEEVGYYPKPAWLNTGTHFVFEQGIVGWTGDTWRMIDRTGKEFEEPLPPNPVPYAPIYANMLRAIQGRPHAPHARELAVDTAIAQAAYASARQHREITLTHGNYHIPQ